MQVQQRQSPAMPPPPSRAPRHHQLLGQNADTIHSSTGEWYQQPRQFPKRIYFRATAGFAEDLRQLTSAFPYHLDKHYAKVMFEDQQPTDVPDGPYMPSIEVTEYIVDVPNDEMEEKDSFRMIVISNPTSTGYNERKLESTEKECLWRRRRS
jgi:hypothetical protein